MNDKWLARWNERYRKPEFAYGTTPNEYLKEQLLGLKAGKILFAAEGEGRNAVYAATKSWEVSAFDISVEGRNKALKLAESNNLVINYQVGQLPELDFQSGQFDAIALIFAHFPPTLKSDYHQRLIELLKPGGQVIFEAFGKNHLSYRSKNPSVGGPPDLDALFSVDEIRADFKGFDVIQLEETEVELKEGLYHNGVGSVVRFRGTKPGN